MKRNETTVKLCGNFFQHFEIGLLDSTTIAGQNGSGKTTLAKFSSGKFYEIRLYFLESIAYKRMKRTAFIAVTGHTLTRRAL